MPKTYAQLKDEIRRQVFASGEAENLVDAHNLIFQEGMADIAKWVECEQERPIDVTPFCASYFKCGMSVVTAPKGIIKRVYTIANDEYCDPVFYEQMDWPGPECMARNLLIEWQQPDTTGLPVLPLGFKKAEATTDRDANDVIFDRARTGVWAIYDGKIWIAPWIQSNEKVVVEWRGIKTWWSDDDLVNESQDFRKAIKLYLQYGHERDYGDPIKANQIHNPIKTGTYDEALADLIWQCREETKMRRTTQCSGERNRTTAELADDVVT